MFDCITSAYGLKQRSSLFPKLVSPVRVKLKVILNSWHNLENTTKKCAFKIDDMTMLVNLVLPQLVQDNEQFNQDASDSILSAAIGPFMISPIVSVPRGKSISKTGSPTPRMLAKTA